MLIAKARAVSTTECVRERRFNSLQAGTNAAAQVSSAPAAPAPAPLDVGEHPPTAVSTEPQALVR